MLKYFAFRLASVLVPILPVWASYGAAWLGAEIAFLTAAGPRRAVYSNLRRVMGPDAPEVTMRETARQVFRTVSYNYVDMFLIPRIPPGELTERVMIMNTQAFLDAYREGKGVLITTAHLGNFDLLVQVSVAYDIPVTVLVEPLSPPQMFDLVNALRSSHGMRLVPVGSHALREVLRVLRSGGVVAIAADRNIKGRGMEVDFFGEPATMPTGAVELAMRTGAAIVPCFGLRLPGRRYEISIYPPVQLMGGAREDGDIRGNMRRLLAVVEDRVRRHPEQWTVFHAVWPGSELALPANTRARASIER